MVYRNLTFRSLASDIRTETYLGEEHIVIPCIALVGDEVVYGMNAEGPEFIPADELEFSTLGWSGRPVLYDHPANSTSTANEPATLQAMSFGQIFHPRFEDNKLKVEAWCNKRRAIEIGQEDLIESIENGEMIELSVGAIISIIRQNGIAPNGKPYIGRWADIMSDHLAIGLSGSKGACNIEMGCGANRVLKTNQGNDEIRTMRAMRGVNMDDPQPVTQTSEAAVEQAVEQSKSKPQTRIQKILSYASRIFRSNTEDEGLSDFDLRSKLWDILYSFEPAFSGIEDVYQDSKTVRYITNPTYPEHKMYLWRRTFDVAEDGAVTVNDDREEVDFAVNYIYLANGDRSDKPSDQPCGCQTVDTGQTVATNETNTQKENTEMADDKDKKPDATKSTTNETTTPTPEKGSSEAATPSQSGNEDKTIPNYPAGVPNPENEVPGSPSAEQLKALLEEHPLVKKYRAQEAQEKSYLVSALGKAQKVYNADQLNAMSVDQLRPIAQLVGISGQTQQPVGDFSGRMMVAREGELPPPPDPWGVAKFLKRGDADN